MTAERFALHVENRLEAPFTDGQAADYEPQARHMLNKPRYLSCGDFATMLLCLKAYAEKLDHTMFFDAVLHHQEAGIYVPEFAARSARRKEVFASARRNPLKTRLL